MDGQVVLVVYTKISGKVIGRLSTAEYPTVRDSLNFEMLLFNR